MLQLKLRHNNVGDKLIETLSAGERDDVDELVLEILAQSSSSISCMLSN